MATGTIIRPIKVVECRFENLTISAANGYSQKYNYSSFANDLTPDNIVGAVNTAQSRNGVFHLQAASDGLYIYSSAAMTSASATFRIAYMP